jgi:hypothetical protein
MYHRRFPVHFFYQAVQHGIRNGGVTEILKEFLYFMKPFKKTLFTSRDLRYGFHNVMYVCIHSSDLSYFAYKLNRPKGRRIKPQEIKPDNRSGGRGMKARLAAKKSIKTRPASFGHQRRSFGSLRGRMRKTQTSSQKAPRLP